MQIDRTELAQPKLFPATPAAGLRIVAAWHGIMTHKQWALAPVAPEVISTALGILSDRSGSSCGKVSIDWEFLADGHPCYIWDYCGRRWSAYGPREVFEALGLLPVEV